MLEEGYSKANVNDLARTEGWVLIGSPVCPFVARARVVALECGVDINVQFIDLLDKPVWFLERSPTGTVPALDTGAHFIFESSVIAEFINESSGGALHPAAAAERAVSRAWTEYATRLLIPQYMMLISVSRAEFEKHCATLDAEMQKVDAALWNTPYFNGRSFSIVDAAYAPFFVRADFLLRVFDIDLLEGLPKMKAWGDALTARPSVLRVHGNEYFSQLKEHMAVRGADLVRFL